MKYFARIEKILDLHLQIVETKHLSGITYPTFSTAHGSVIELKLF